MFMVIVRSDVVIDYFKGFCWWRPGMLGCFSCTLSDEIVENGHHEFDEFAEGFLCLYEPDGFIGHRSR